MSNPTSTSDPNRFVSVNNAFASDILNEALFSGADNVFYVPQAIGTVQGAIDQALAEGHDQYDPAIILITPDSSTGSSVTDVQFTEDITLYDGIYLISAVPHKKVNISGTLSLGSTAVGTDGAGVNNADVRYLLQDIKFIDNVAGAILTASTALVTQIDMTRVDIQHTGTAAGDIAMNVSATAVHTINMNECNLSSTSGIATDATLSVITENPVVHVVNIKHRSSITQAGAGEFAIIVGSTSRINIYDSSVTGRISIDTAATQLNMYNCLFTHATVVGTAGSGLISVLADVAVVITLDHCSFFVTDGDLDYVIDTNGVGTSANPVVTGRGNSGSLNITGLAASDLASASTSWDGGPIFATAGPTSNTLYYNTDAVTRVA